MHCLWIPSHEAAVIASSDDVVAGCGSTMTKMALMEPLIKNPDGTDALHCLGIFSADGADVSTWIVIQPLPLPCAAGCASPHIPFC